MSAKNALDDYCSAIRRRGDRATEREFRQLRELWKAADREHEADLRSVPQLSARGIAYFPAPPPPWEMLVVEFAPAESVAERSPAESLADTPPRLPPGRSREEVWTEAMERLRRELTKRRGGKPSLRSIEKRMRELGYPVSYRRVRETWLAMRKPGD